MLLAQESRNEIVGLGIILENIVQLSVKVRFLSKSVDQFLEVHLALDEQQFDCARVADVTGRIVNF